MPTLSRRLDALERVAPDDGWRPVLNALSLDDLERLEQVIMTIDEAERRLGSRELAIADLPAEDQQLLEKVSAMRESIT
jgi:hypothetical protein